MHRKAIGMRQNGYEHKVGQTTVQSSHGNGAMLSRSHGSNWGQRLEALEFRRRDINCHIAEDKHRGWGGDLGATVDPWQGVEYTIVAGPTITYSMRLSSTRNPNGFGRPQQEKWHEVWSGRLTCKGRNIKENLSDPCLRSQELTDRSTWPI